MCKFAHGLGELKEVPVDTVNRRLRKMLSPWLLNVGILQGCFSSAKSMIFKSKDKMFFIFILYFPSISGGCLKLQSVKWRNHGGRSLPSGKPTLIVASTFGMRTHVSVCL